LKRVDDQRGAEEVEVAIERGGGITRIDPIVEMLVSEIIRDQDLHYLSNNMRKMEEKFGMVIAIDFMAPLKKMKVQRTFMITSKEVEIMI
jgi:hypothetical protein